jgi:hypothetical protein
VFGSIPVEVYMMSDAANRSCAETDGYILPFSGLRGETAAEVCRLSVVSNGRWIDLQNDVSEGAGFTLSLKTDGTSVRVDIDLTAGSNRLSGWRPSA